MAKKMKGKVRSMQITLGVHIRNAKGVKFHGLLCCCASVCVWVSVIVGSVCGMCGVSFCSHCGSVLNH